MPTCADAMKADTVTYLTGMSTTFLPAHVLTRADSILRAQCGNVAVKRTAMHDQARRFLNFVFASIVAPDASAVHTMLDCGSGDINGNNRAYCPPLATYIGNDLRPGRNVDLVCETGAITLPSESLDVVVSSECFEHDLKYEASLRNIHRMLRVGGLFIFTCASTGRPEHGTLRTSPGDSLSTGLPLETGWPTYYKNLTIDDVAAALPLSEYAWRAYYNAQSKDLYFVGQKGSAPLCDASIEYDAPCVSRVYTAPASTV